MTEAGDALRRLGWSDDPIRALTVATATGWPHGLGSTSANDGGHSSRAYSWSPCFTRSG